MKMLICNFESLMDKEEAITTSTMLEIDRMRKNGGLLVVTSTKELNEIIDYNYSFPFIDYIITYQGSLLYEVETGKVLYKNPITSEKVKELEKDTEEKIEYNNEVYVIKTTNEEIISKIKKLNLKYISIKKDIYISETDKLDALNILCEKKNIKQNEVISIGLDDSDMSIQKATYGISMRNSNLKIKNNSYYMTNSTYHNGVRDVIQKFF